MNSYKVLEKTITRDEFQSILERLHNNIHHPNFVSNEIKDKLARCIQFMIDVKNELDDTNISSEDARQHKNLLLRLNRQRKYLYQKLNALGEQHERY